MTTRSALVFCVALLSTAAAAKPAVSIVAPPTAAVGDEVSLESNVIDPGAGNLDYQWHQSVGVAVRLSTPTARSTNFVVPPEAAGSSLTFELIVSDGLNSSDPASASIAVAGSTRPNHPPVSIPGDPVTVSAGASVTLDGSRSSDPDGEVLTYNWQQVGGAAKAVLTGADTPRVRVTAPKNSVVSTIDLQLTVTDPEGATGVATVTVTIEPAGCGCVSASSADLMLFAAVLTLLVRRLHPRRLHQGLRARLRPEPKRP
jgi:chitinase